MGIYHATSLETPSGAVSLEWGTVRPEVVNSIRNIKMSDLRHEDGEELLDFLFSLGFSLEEIARDFGELLALSLGVQKDVARYYSILTPYELSTSNDVYQPFLFVATVTRSTVNSANEPGVVTLCGAGLELAYKYLTKRQIYAAMKVLISRIFFDMDSVFNSKHAVCHVKATNKRTLTMWHFLKRCKYANPVQITVSDDPFQRGYKLVSINLEDMSRGF